MFQSMTAEEVAIDRIELPVAQLGEFGEHKQPERIKQIAAERERRFIHKQHRCDSKECNSLQPDINSQVVRVVPIYDAQHSGNHRRHEHKLFEFRVHELCQHRSEQPHKSYHHRHSVPDESRIVRVPMVIP